MLTLQYEEVVSRVNNLRSDMQSKQELARSQRAELLAVLRPQAIIDAEALVKESDSMLKLQMLKYGKAGQSKFVADISSTSRDISVKSMPGFLLHRFLADPHLSLQWT